MKYLCKNEPKRDEIIFGSYDKEAYSGGIRQFEEMTYNTLKQLIDEGFVDLEERQNCAPTIKELMDFAEKWGKESYRFGGYVVSADRDDYRVSIDTFTKNCEFESFAERDAFADLANEADELDLDYAYAWWD